jgi:hypothetical protein
MPESENQDGIYTTLNTANAFGNTPVAAAPPAPLYSQTAARVPLSFETVKPDANSGAPVISFTSLRRTDPVLQPFPEYAMPSSPLPTLPQHSPAPQAPELVIPTVLPNTARNTNVNPKVNNPIVKSAEQEALEKHIYAQLLLLESGEPEKIRRAYIQLGMLYEREELGEAERAIIQPILDMLAVNIIYARDTHLLEPPHRVKPGETVESIAKHYNLTPVLLRKINGLAPTQELPPGVTLKVLHGQFDARISVKRKELTFLLGGLYAGRCSFTMPQPGMSLRSGDYFVMQRSERAIVLNNGLVLATAPANDAAFVFSEADAQDLFDILSAQSVIVIE